MGFVARTPSLAGHHALSRLAERPDPELVELVRRGDRDAWGVLIKRHDHRVVLSLLARGVRLDQARELAQQTWARLIAQQDAGRLERIELPGIAIRQAGFLALDAARRRDAAAPGSPDTEVIDPEASIEDRLIRREELARVQAELARCSPVARELFALLYADPEMRHAGRTPARAERPARASDPVRGPRAPACRDRSGAVAMTEHLDGACMHRTLDGSRVMPDADLEVPQVGLGACAMIDPLDTAELDLRTALPHVASERL